MKNLKNLGEILNKEEQQSINGGWATYTCQVACEEGPSNPYFDKCSCDTIITDTK